MQNICRCKSPHGLASYLDLLMKFNGKININTFWFLLSKAAHYSNECGDQGDGTGWPCLVCYCHVFWRCHLFVIQLLSVPHFRFYRSSCKKQTGWQLDWLSLTCRYKTRLGPGASRYKSHVSQFLIRLQGCPGNTV